MGMLDLFREWQNKVDNRFRPRRRFGFERCEELERRQMLTAILVGTTLTVDATAGPDTIQINQDASGVKVTENGVDTSFAPAMTINTIKVLGQAGDDQITIKSIFDATVLNVDGGTGLNTFIAPTGPNNWLISGPNSGQWNGKSFTNIQNLTGGGFNDNFKFTSTGFVGGTVDGGGGIDKLDYAGRNTGVVVNISAATATAIGANFVNISDFIGSSDNTDLLVGPSTATDNVWHINSGNSGDINLQQFFSGFENLTGGSTNDAFVFGSAGFAAGNISGGGGMNTLVYSQRSVGVVTNLQFNSSTAIGGTFNKIGQVIGSTSGSDSLTGINNTNTWSIGGADSGSVKSVFSTMNFTGYEYLVGGNVSDTFKFAPAGVVSGSVNGGLGNNTLDYSQRVDGITTNLQTRTSTAIVGGFLNIQNLIGSGGNTPGTYDTLIATDAITNDWNITSGNAGNINGTFFFSSIENLTGGKQADIYHFMPVGFVSGVVNAGLGVNTLDYSSRNNGIVVGVQTSLSNVPGLFTSPASAIGGGYAYITNLIGTSDVDTVIGANSLNTWNLTGFNTGNVNSTFNFTGIESLTGGIQTDVFHLAPGAVFTGTVSGGLNNNAGDWLDYSPLLTQVTVNLSAGIATNIGQIVNIQNVHGSDGVNTLTGNAMGNILVGGISGDTILAGPGRSLIIGGAGADTVTGNTKEDIVISSFTNYDSNLNALASILAEWQSANTFDQRVNNLRNGGGLNKNNVLVADVTVRNDAAPDVIRGAGGRNWLWGQPAEFQDLTAQDISDTPINNPPVLTGASYIIYTTKQTATPVNTVLTISDIDSTTLASATVQITSNYNPSQDALGFSPSAATGNITGSFNSATGTLTLTSLFSTATVAQFQAALRNVSYWNSSTTPTTAPRTVVYQAFDGLAYSNSLTSTVYFNSAPSIAGTSAINYSAFQAPTVINSVLTVSDPNNTTLSYATVSLSNIFFPLEDVLGFVGSGLTGNITGSYNNATGVLTLSSAGASASLANFQAALRSVTYSNTSFNPSLFKRTVTFQVNDGAAFSNTVNSTVTVS